MAKNKINPPAQATEIDKQKAFLAAYEKLCAEHGYRITGIPQWRQSADTGTWSTVVQDVIVPINNQNGGV